MPDLSGSVAGAAAGAGPRADTRPADQRPVDDRRRTCGFEGEHVVLVMPRRRAQSGRSRSLVARASCPTRCRSPATVAIEALRRRRAAGRPQPARRRSRAAGSIAPRTGRRRSRSWRTRSSRAESNYDPLRDFAQGRDGADADHAGRSPASTASTIRSIPTRTSKPGMQHLQGLLGRFDPRAGAGRLQRRRRRRGAVRRRPAVPGDPALRPDVIAFYR